MYLELFIHALKLCFNAFRTHLQYGCDFSVAQPLSYIFDNELLLGCEQFPVAIHCSVVRVMYASFRFCYCIYNIVKGFFANSLKKVMNSF